METQEETSGTVAAKRGLLVGIGAGMLLVVTLGVLGQFLVGWIETGLDDLHYGRPLI